MAPKYVLTYFNVTALAEPIRLLFSYAGVDFEDVRVEFSDWPALKPKMPMEQLPVLEIDGKVYNQSRAIGRYLAKKFDLYGSNEIEALRIDAAVDTIEDLRQLCARFFREDNDEFKTKLKTVAMEKLPIYMKKFEDQAKSHNGYLATDKLSWADITFAAISEFLDNILETSITKDYPTLKKLVETVRSQPKIKAYLEKRPKPLF